eukprot:TRINITY_DN957_c1_g1_i1.p1 TRINITY_DN957_c1_g1~~TRINITY_DN957_c1_g1_i1.p1  ORF type:complete len:236 (-),score=10.25 TRINITY_DN957_c1_g1_i1:77-784(-)
MRREGYKKGCGRVIIKNGQIGYRQKAHDQPSNQTTRKLSKCQLKNYVHEHNQQHQRQSKEHCCQSNLQDQNTPKAKQCDREVSREIHKRQKHLRDNFHEFFKISKNKHLNSNKNDEYNEGIRAVIEGDLDTYYQNQYYYEDDYNYEPEHDQTEAERGQPYVHYGQQLQLMDYLLPPALTDIETQSQSCESTNFQFVDDDFFVNGCGSQECCDQWEIISESGSDHSYSSYEVVETY